MPLLHRSLLTRLLLLCAGILAFSVADAKANHGNQIDLLRLEGARLTVYGRFTGDARTKVYFGANEAPALFEPRVLNSSSRAIELLLPFEPIQGRYRLKIGASVASPKFDVLLDVGENGAIIFESNAPPESTEVGIQPHAPGDNVECGDTSDHCAGPTNNERVTESCTAVADFDPYRGSQAITIEGTQELYLDEAFTIEARVFVRDFVRSGIIVDKYSGSGRGREYRLSVNREGLLRGWFSVDGSLGNVRVVLSSEPLPKGRWVHVAAVFNGQTMKLFIDGKLTAEKALRGRPSQLGYQNIAIGGNNCCDGYYEVFNGLIDDVRISSIPRYRGNFAPPLKAYDSDAATLLLLDFDDDVKNKGIIGGAARLTEFNRIGPCPNA